MLKVYALIQTPIPSLGYIKVTFPAVITTQPSTACSLTSPTGLSVTCSYSNNATTNQIILTAKISGKSITDYFELNIQNFKNPASTLRTDSFSIQTYDSSNLLMDEQTSFIYLTATADSLLNASIDSSTQRVGDTGQELTVNFKTKNVIPINGKIFVKFPYWNPDAQNTQYTLQSYLQLTTSTAQCEGLVNIAFNPTCNFDTSTQTLTLSNGFFGQSIPAGTSMSFKIKNFRNPIITQQISGFVVSTGDSSSLNGLIDQAALTLQMSTVGQIGASNVKINLSTVQELTQYRVEFLVPVPLSQGCILEIQFPSQITLDSSQITLVQAFGLPSTQRTLSGVIDRNKNSYTVANACPSYRDNTNSAIIYFTNIQNPKYVMTSNSIEVYIYDQNSQMLVSTNEQGPKVTTTQGTINLNALTSDLVEINSLTGITFKFQPLHKSAQDSKIVITLPSGQTRVQNTCTITSKSILSKLATCTSNTVDNTITILNSFDTEYSYSSSQSIEFKISDIQLPPTTADTGVFKFQVFTTFAGSYFLVDESSQSNLIKATKGMLSYGIVTSSSLIANQIANYKFQFGIGNPILQNGYIIIDFPSQLKIPVVAQASCSNFINIENSATCVFTQSQVRINNGFQLQGLTDKSLEISITINGIQNPRSIQTTSSFTVSTYASDGSLIDTRNDQMSITMTGTIAVTIASVQPNTLVVGSVNTYTFKFTAPTPLITGDYLLIQFPQELNQPLSNTLQSCNGITNLASTLTCSINGAYGLRVRLQFTTTMQTNTQFALSVKSVANPKSGDPSGLFQASIQDAQSYEINKNNPNLANFKVQMAQGAIFQYVKVTHQSSKPFIQTAYTITFRLENSMPAQARVKIVYPDQITANSTAFACTVSQFGANPQCSIDTAKNLIIIRNATQTTLEAGTTYTITLQGLINSKFAAETDSFQIETQTPDAYIINYVYQFITVTNECDYPCFTCLSTKVSQCTSCDANSQLSILLNTQCVSSCPKTYYSTDNQCLLCDKNCAECAGGPKLCTKCPTGMYLQGATCVSQCSSNQYIQNNLTWECNKCQEPCATCQTKVNYCTSCLQNLNQRYFYSGFCYAQCPLGTFLNEQGSCSQCDTNCLSCLTTGTTCTSCRSPLKLNKYENNCVESCPLGLTTDTGTTCEYCDPKCRTCDLKNPKKCLSCSSGLSLYDKTSECLGQCPNGTVTITDQQTTLSTCKSCNTGCSSCQNTQDYCTKCDDALGYLFYKFSCMKTCPDGYTRLSKDRNICVRAGEVCPFGYEYNDYGECALVLQICEPGYILNSDKTKCIPVPGAYVPIIFLIICLGWTLFVLIKYKKTRSTIEKITMLLFGYTIVQSIVYLIMFALSFTLDYMMVKVIHILTYIFMYITNAAFAIEFDKKRKKNDMPFRHWETEHKQQYYFYKHLMYIFSFKLGRGLYSKVIDKKPLFNAAFGDQYKTMIFPLFIVTIVNFLLQVLPIMLMDIYNFIFIPWGYQFMVMGIDNLVLGLVIFILEIIEFTHYKKLAEQEGNLMKPSFGTQYPKHLLDDNVMSVADDVSMLALNKYIQPSQRDINLDQIGKEIYNHEKGKKSKLLASNEPSEKDVLQKLVRKLKEEQKFNKIYDDKDSNSEEDYDIEKVGKSRQKYLQEIIPSGPGDIQETKPRNQAYDARERLENKLSFRNINKQGAPLITALQEKIYRDLQGQMFPNDLSGINLLNQTNDYPDQTMDLDDSRQQLLESARTEKFYNANDQSQLEPLNLEKIEDKPKSKQVSFLPSPNKDYPQFRERANSFDNIVKIPMHRIDFDEPSQNKIEFNKFKEEFTEKLARQKEELKLEPRDWHSCDDEIMREWYDDLSPESDFDPSEITHVSYPDVSKKLIDPDYLARLELFRELMKSKYHYNNIYTQLTDPHNAKNYNQAKSKNVTRRTQTYEKDIAIGYDPFAKDDNYQFLLDEDQIAEIDVDYVEDLIWGVIDKLSEEESFIEMKKDTLPDKDSEDSDFDFEKMKLSKKRKKDIQFDLDDIMGMFDIDDFGNIQLNLETMRDNLNRKVNKNGYLIDNLRNIINQDGDIIFEVDELDEDEEIPMPYRFEKRKKQLLKQEEKFAIDKEYGLKSERQQFDLDSILQGEEDKIEEEFLKLKDISRDGSVDSLIGDLPNKFDKANLDNIDNNDQDKLQSLAPLELTDENNQESKDDIDKRQKELAKAYGGKPPASKKKKKTNKKKRGDDNRLPTDRVFSYLDQEEERVKRMAMISYAIENNNPIKPSFQQKVQEQQQQLQTDEDEVMQQQPTPQTKDFEQYFRDQMQEINQFRLDAQQQYQQQLYHSQQHTHNQYIPQIPAASMFQGVGNIAGDDDNRNGVQKIQFYVNNEDEQNPLQRMDSDATDKIQLQQLLPYQQHVDKDQEITEMQADHMKDLIEQDAEKANRFFDRIQRNKSNNSALQTYSTNAHQQNVNINQNLQNYHNRAATSGAGIQSQLINRNQIQRNLLMTQGGHGAQSNMNFYHANPQFNQQPQSAMSMSTIPLSNNNNNTTLNLQLNILNNQLFMETHNNDQYEQQMPVDMQQFSHIMPQDRVAHQSSNQLRKFDFYLPIQKNAANQAPKVKNKLQKNKETKDVSFSLIGRMQMQNANNTNNGQDDGQSSRIKGLERVYLQKYPVAPKTMLHEQAHIKRKIGGGQFRTNTLSDLQNQNQGYKTTYAQNISSGTGGVFSQALNQDLMEFDVQSQGNIPIRQIQQDNNFINETNPNSNLQENNIDNWF
eukprot:403330882